jgi:hypothetical protein
MNVSNTAPMPITRAAAERLITAYQLIKLARSGYRTTCELYAKEGGGPCPGLHGYSDTVLREIYRPYVEGVDRLGGWDLLDAVIDFEKSQLDPLHKTTCQVMAEAGRLCDGLSRYTNQELPWVFPDVLKGRTVID